MQKIKPSYCGIWASRALCSRSATGILSELEYRHVVKTWSYFSATINHNRAGSLAVAHDQIFYTVTDSNTVTTLQPTLCIKLTLFSKKLEELQIERRCTNIYIVIKITRYISIKNQLQIYGAFEPLQTFVNPFSSLRQSKPSGSPTIMA